MSARAHLFRMTFDGNKAATVELPQPTRLQQVTIHCTDVNLGGGQLAIEASLDGTNFAPVEDSPYRRTGVTPVFDLVAHSLRFTLSSHSDDVTVVLRSGLAGATVRALDGSVNVATVTPA